MKEWTQKQIGLLKTIFQTVKSNTTILVSLLPIMHLLNAILIELLKKLKFVLTEKSRTTERIIVSKYGTAFTTLNAFMYVKRIVLWRCLCLMQISFQQLRDIMKESGIPVFRDGAPTSATYPYIVYEYVNEFHKRSSNRVIKSLPLYQIAIITDGTESDYEPLKEVFNRYGVPYEMFFGIPFDENDETITQFITNVRCVQ